MKPSDFKIPYVWNERRPFIQEGLFSIPVFYPNYSEFVFPKFSDRMVFGNHNPVHCEVCSGNGDWIIKKARENPFLNWIAVEKRFDRIRKILSKKSNGFLTNLFVVFGDAFTFFSHYLQSGVIESIHIYFPDPWPKVRHTKNRLIRESFIKESRRSLKNGGEFVLTTDDYPLIKTSVDLLLKPGWQSLFSTPYYLVSQETEDSWFEKLWRSKGKEIYRTSFRKWDIADLNS